MEIKGLIWFDDIIEKLIRKHNVQQSEVREIKRALILSARDMTKTERRLYEKT